jgi:hypothetical protein
MKIQAIVKPGKRENKIEIENGIYFVELKEKAEKGKANISLIKLLAKHFNVSSANVRIISGFAAHKKIVEVK